MTILFPTRVTPEEIRLAHSRGASLTLGLIGAAGAVLCYMLMPDSPVRLAFAGMAAIIALPLLAGGLHRYEIAIDLARRRWRRRTGLAFASRGDAGSLDDLNGLSLELRHVRRGGRSSARASMPTWTVWLEFVDPSRGDDRVCIAIVEQDELRAYRLLEHYAKSLRVDAIDRTATVPERRGWDALGPLADDVAHAAIPRDAAFASDLELHAASPGSDTLASVSPPTRFGMEVKRDEEGHPLLLLPPHGVSVITVVAIGFGAVLGGSGAIFLAGGLGLGPFSDDGSGPEPVMIALGGLFVLLAIRAITAAVTRAGSREWVVELPDALRFGITRAGKTRAYTELPKRSIEEVAVRTPAEGGSRLHVFGVRVRLDSAGSALIRVRTDHGVVRLGRRLAPDAKAWLRDTIAARVGVAAR